MSREFGVNTNHENDHNSPERRFWDEVPQQSAGESSATTGAEAVLEANVQLVDQALRSMELLAEPPTMKANIEAELARLARSTDAPIEAERKPSNLLQPMWRQVLTVQRGRLALAAAALLAVGTVGVVLVRQGPAVDPEEAVGSLGMAVSAREGQVDSGAALKIAGTGQGQSVHLRTEAFWSDGAPVAVFELRGGPDVSASAVRADGTSVEGVPLGEGLVRFEVALGLAEKGVEILLDEGAVAGQVVAGDNGALAWNPQ